MNRLKLLLIAAYVYQSELALGSAIETQLTNTAKKGQRLLMATIPIFMLVVAYLYKRGKPEAKEKLESLVIGSLIAVTAFSWSYFFK